MTASLFEAGVWLERALLTVLGVWALCVWLPAWTHALWFASLIARETAHLGVLLLLVLLVLRPPQSLPAVTLLALLMVLLAWPLVTTLTSPRARPDFSAWPGAGGAGIPGVASALMQAPGLAPASVAMSTHRYRESPVPLSLDHYRGRAHNNAPRAWMMVVHGGAWRGGSRTEHSGFNRALAALGVDVFAVDYRLAPEWRYPAPLDDLAAALAWIEENARVLGVDASAGHLLGRSAGGQLALQLAYSEEGRGLRLVVGVYPPADMVYAGTAPFNRRVLDARAVLHDYLGSRWADDPAPYEASSPLLSVTRSDLPATLLLHGPDDAMVAFEHTRRLAQALRTHGVPVAAVVLPWMQHGGDVVAIGPSAWFTFRAVVAALMRVSPGMIPQQAR